MESCGRAATGEEVHEVGLEGGGLRARVLTLGAIVRELRLEGWPHPLVLGFADIAAYERVGGYVGAVVGRYANRIAAGRFVLDGRTVELAANEGPNILHGGAGGFARRVWRVVDARADAVALQLISPDGDQGFPGRLTATVTYRLGEPAALDMIFEATTEAPTVVNLTQHSYYRLDGAPTIDAHRLHVAAGTYLPVDAADLPVAGPAALAGTAFDLRRPSSLAGPAGPRRLDHNYVLAARRRDEPVWAATLYGDGLAMHLATTEPGLQIYTGDRLEGGPPPRAGLCLEPQTWPDAPNRATFPSPFLRPGEAYRHHTRLEFERPRRSS